MPLLLTPCAPPALQSNACLAALVAPRRMLSLWSVLVAFSPPVEPFNRSVVNVSANSSERRELLVKPSDPATLQALTAQFDEQLEAVKWGTRWWAYPWVTEHQRRRVAK